MNDAAAADGSQFNGRVGNGYLLTNAAMLSLGDETMVAVDLCNGPHQTQQQIGGGTTSLRGRLRTIPELRISAPALHLDQALSLQRM